MYTYSMPSLKSARMVRQAHHKKGGWKIVQNKNKLKKKTKLAIAVLGLIVLLIFIGNLVKLTQTLLSPWKLSGKQTKSYIWDGEFNLNLVVKKNSSVSVISYNPKENRIILLKIPETVVVEVPGEFGEWQLRSVYDLGETNKKGEGIDLLKQTIVTFLGIPIDGFLDIGDLNGVFDTDAELEILRKNVIFSLTSFFSIKTDLTLWELIRLKIGIASTRFDKVEKLDLTKVLDKGNLADGTQVFLADPVKLDSMLTGFADPAIKAEQKTIAIFNATERLALAQKASRIITNMGGNVIITSNAPKKAEGSQVLGEKSLTLKRINQVFNLTCKVNSKECDKIEQEGEEILSSRAQINVILGTDF